MNGARRPRGRVLVVDDSESTRYIVATWLRRNGYLATEAATGGEALARVAGSDLVVLDVHLPDMTGFEVCAAIKADPATAAVPVLHVSATAVSVTDRAAGLNGGADGYLTEPVDPEELLATVQALLRYSGERRKAERLAERLGRLTRASLTINAAHTRSELLAAASTEASALFEGPAAIVDLSEEGGTIAVAEVGREPRQLRPPGGWVDAVDPSTTGVVEGGDLLAAWCEVLGKDVEAVLVVPAAGRGSSGRVVLAAAVEPDSRFGTEDELLGRQFTQSLTLALENLRLLTEEQRIAMTLQQSLLPAKLPVVPGLRLDARYSASSEHALVGGDFYDALALPSGEVVVVIGDVQGHSLAAATIMAELRYSLRAYILEGHTATDVLARVDVLLAQGHPEETATVCLLQISADRRSVIVANAGHLPPLLLQNGTARFVESGGVLLGLGSRSEAVEVELSDDDVIVLVTDGLVERRGISLDQSLEQLAKVALDNAGDSEGLSDRLIRHFAERNGKADDDMAVVVVARLPT
ncbi:MAG TPA: SpoIIE family protein phosphatase [Acidimicrobiia bacterium]|nr:SpoIIE family protein phosphatase [Acidimicrobiia bacterium]